MSAVTMEVTVAVTMEATAVVEVVVVTVAGTMEATAVVEVAANRHCQTPVVRCANSPVRCV